MRGVALLLLPCSSCRPLHVRARQARGDAEGWIKIAKRLWLFLPASRFAPFSRAAKMDMRSILGKQKNRARAFREASRARKVIQLFGDLFV